MVVARCYQLRFRTSLREKLATGVDTCQVKIEADMNIELEAEVFSIEKWECTVRSNHMATPSRNSSLICRKARMPAQVAIRWNSPSQGRGGMIIEEEYRMTGTSIKSVIRIRR